MLLAPRGERRLGAVKVNAAFSVSVPGASDSTMGREVSPGGSESSMHQLRKRKPQPIVWDGPPAGKCISPLRCEGNKAVLVCPLAQVPAPTRAPRAVARHSRGRGGNMCAFQLCC